MIRLLKIEWTKFFYNKGTRIFLILYFLMILLMGVIIPNFKPNMNGQEINFIKFGGLEFPVIWQNIAWLISWGKLFLGIIVINNITNEYSFGTLKQNTIDGLTKNEFFQSKLLMNFLFTLISTALVVILVAVLGSQFNEKFDFFNGIEFALAYFVEVFTFVIFAMFLAILLKRSVFAILAIIALSIGESVVKAIEFFMRFAKNTNHEKIEDATTFSNYLPLNSNAKVIDYPPMSLSKLLTQGKLFDLPVLQWEFLITNVAYLIIFLSLSLFILKKRDL